MFDVVLQLEGYVELLYPGSEVPRWFSHRSMESSITIQFPLNWVEFKGVVFCIIFEFKKPSKEFYDTDQSGLFEIGFKMDGEVHKRLLSFSCHVPLPNSSQLEKKEKSTICSSVLTFKS